MQDRLYKKFLLSFLAFSIISLGFIMLVGGDLVHRLLAQQKAIELRQLAKKISQDMMVMDKSGSHTDSTVSKLDTISEYENIEIWIVGSNAEIVYSSNNTGSSAQKTILKNIYPYKIGLYYGIGDFDKIFLEDKLSVIHPIVQEYKTLGYIMLHYNYLDVRLQGDGVIKIFFMIVGFIFFIALIIFIVLGTVIIRPINSITRAVKEYASGNLGYVVELSSADELGLLAAALNDMSSELEKTEEYQKRLIANISHDFRSPLTSIKGYIEALLDGTIQPEMQEKYLNIILKESKRLTELTEELLELNKADSNKLHLDMQAVNINMLIRDTVASFEQRCLQNLITIELIFENEDAYVMADAGRIQQVLHNLVDNAIKFSPNDSKIIIETTSQKDKLIISVKDHGCGIASDELKNIWERFYKSDSSRGRDKYSSGLGLSIVKEIIQLHNENINVVSTQNAGTTFIFTLTLMDE